MQLKKSEIQSGIATTIICIIILLILLFCGMTAHKNEMDEGVMISLGYADEGFGESMPNPTPAPEAAPVPTPTPPPAAPEVSTPTEEDLMTQEDPSVALEAEKKRKEAAGKWEPMNATKENVLSIFLDELGFFKYLANITLKNSKASQLTYDDITNIIKQGKEIGTFVYLYTGGEPLMRKKDLIRICEEQNVFTLEEVNEMEEELNMFLNGKGSAKYVGKLPKYPGIEVFKVQ